MTKRAANSGKSTRRSSRQSGGGSTTKIVLSIVAFLCLVLVVFLVGGTAGVITLLEELGMVTPSPVASYTFTVQTAIVSTQPPTTPTRTAALTPEPGGGDWIEVYFNSPRIPDDKKYTGGLDEVFIERVVERAKQTLYMAAFELDLESVADALIEAKKRGVDVRIVTDDETREDDDEREDIYKNLKKAGIPIVDDERGALMHNKFVVVDGRLVWTGSMNFTINGVYRNNNNAVLIDSPELAKNYTVEFNEMFEDGEFGPSSPSNTPKPVLNIAGHRVESYFASEDDVMGKIAAELKKAKSSIRFMAFSFTEDSLGDILREKAKEGVLVQGVFETTGSETEYSEYPRLKRAKIDVLQDGNPGVLHHKVFIVDEKVVLTGSFNFSQNAANSNDENLLIIEDPAVAAKYVEEFNRVYDLAKKK